MAQVTNFNRCSNPSSSTLFTSGADITLFQMYNLLLDRQIEMCEEGIITKATIRKYNRLKLDLLEYTEDIPLKDITPSFVKSFNLHLLKRVKKNTANNKLKMLRTMFSMAVEERYLLVSPFKMRLCYDEVETIPLEEWEVEKLGKKRFRKPSLARVRDIFIFQCYTGLSYCDCKSLTKEDFKEGMIIKKRGKTNMTAYIPILPKAEYILKKYNYKLPVISNQRYNDYLKDVDPRLHSHLARHTFASILINKGVQMTVISKILGHANTKITEKTYARFTNKTIANSILGLF